jgi:uncharacterized Zn finger protein
MTFPRRVLNSREIGLAESRCEVTLCSAPRHPQRRKVAWRLKRSSNPKEWRMSWYGYGDFAPYVPVATKIARGHAAAKKLAAREGRSPAPVKIEGRKIAKTFWGIKWCENLERYRDYANRLPRGATYVRNGSVADLVIEPGCVRAVVGGSEAYTINIKIKTLPPAVWNAIGRDCASEIESLFDLLQGRFSDAVMTRLTRAEDGLFPRPNEITMSCTCPDGAGVCKHIAATMYGVGSRLDVRPELLFTLRKVDHHELIGHAATTANLDQSLSSADGMALSDGELRDIFGIEMEPSAKTAGKKPTRKTVKNKTVKKKPAAKVSAQVVASPVTNETTKTKAVASTAANKRRATKDVVVTEAKRPSPRASTSSVKVTTRSKASAATSVHIEKSKIPSKSAAPQATTTTAGKPSAARTKSRVPRAAKKPARARRTK